MKINCQKEFVKKPIHEKINLPNLWPVREMGIEHRKIVWGSGGVGK